MTTTSTIFDFSRLESGELYLFLPTASSTAGVWGMFERLDRRRGVLLSVCSGDLTHFDLWTPLPSGYTCCRLASRSELQDFMFRLNQRFTDDGFSATEIPHP